MKVERYIVFLLVVVLAGCQHMPEVEMSTRRCADFPAGGRASACACAMNGKGYVLGGRDAKGIYHNDLWQYDPVADNWTSLGTMPGAPRVNAVIIGYQGCLYVGLGYAHKNVIYTESDYLRDWWRYNPATNQWDSLAPYPDVTTIAAVPYVADNRIYVLYGATETPSRQINWYDPAANSWYQEEDDHYRASSAFKPVGAQIQDQYYLGLGYNQKNLTQWYRVTLKDNQWTKCTSLPGKGRTFSACCATDHYIYVFGGRYFGGEMTGGEVFADMVRFNPDNDEWARGGAMPCGEAENQIAFAINGKAYFGLGENTNGATIAQLYCIEE